MVSRLVVTGAPGAGKSTLLETLAARGMAVEREVARSILQAPGGMEMRARRPQDFARAMLEAESAAYARAAMNCGATLFDRGFPDIAGFLKVEGLPVIDAVERACRDRRYTGPIFRAPPWREIYWQDEERIQDWDGAVASDAAICAAWRMYGYELIDLPLASADERADFVLRQQSN
ncbi:AAA family ATPase [Pseudoblastomonas halimionae]|uniref:AAA family ATPase n=1 Tax=Alteriqipengyuania halimionae TaxID=1926630 RepID=A0A6I4U7P2_9SPHN|nr:AAA family ATPase [Alteriqipengyuania halimionae]MXP10845.1 AAA family ATPase [Alteriqipengyuania halimionae]